MSAPGDNRRRLLGAFYWLLVIYLFMPLLVMMVMSFKDANFVGFPINRWSWRWYEELFNDREIIRAFTYSVTLSVTATALTVPVALLCALSLTNMRGWWRGIFFALVCLPAIVPEIVNAISLRIFVRTINLQPGFLATVLAFASHAVPFATLIVLARLSAMPRSHVEAAKDLGANDLTAFLRVTLPFLRPALIGGAMFAMLASFDDFVRAFFMGGYNQTMTVFIYSRFMTGFSPGITAISTTMMVITLVVGLIAESYSKKAREI